MKNCMLNHWFRVAYTFFYIHTNVTSYTRNNLQSTREFRAATSFDKLKKIHGPLTYIIASSDTCKSSSEVKTIFYLQDGENHPFADFEPYKRAETDLAYRAITIIIPPVCGTRATHTTHRGMRGCVRAK